MCGIVGIRFFDQRTVELALLRRMSGQIAHRGPDSEGYWSDGPIGFGHRRLSIIDPSGSHQPMDSNRVVVCYNGEVFNYRELRAEMPSFRFRSRGDTEVLIALYERFGAEGVTRLDGQFAFALYDKQTRDLWLFRDRLGILPLYYAWDGTRFIFGSEIKAILPALPDRPEVDERSLVEYLAYRSVPWPNTLFKGIRKLPPGHWLRIDTGGKVHLHQYWRLPRATIGTPISTKDAVERVSSSLEAAVRSRLISDVPVGAYLSGGVDSSLIVALMRRERGDGRIDTFSAGFDDPRNDEIQYARDVSRRFRTRHHEVTVTPRDFRELWPKLTWHRDAPLSEPADVAVYMLATAARQSVKVLLSGEGADELFAGYPKYRFAYVAGLADALPRSLRQPLLGRAERLLPARASRLRVMLRAMTAANEADRFREWFAPFTEYERQRLTGEAGNIDHHKIWREGGGDLLRRMLYFDCHTWLVDNLLERGDRMAMAASIEYRPPFLDHGLVELAFALPSRLKIRWGRGKWVLKEVARAHLPKEIVDRRKVGFRLPLDRWFRGDLLGYARDMLLAQHSFVSEVFDKPTIRALIQDHASGRRSEGMRIWTLLGLELWHETFIRAGNNWTTNPVDRGGLRQP